MAETGSGAGGRSPNQGPPAASAAPGNSAPASSTARRVLIIEDNVDAAESLREVLEFGGHVVQVAFTGADGVEAARAFRPHVVLCDIGLPTMDGYSVARAMRADPQLAEAHLIAVTGYALPDDLDKARRAGFDRHLAKPPDLEILERLLAEIPAR